jgi:hypothetical protein
LFAEIVLSNSTLQPLTFDFLLELAGLGDPLVEVMLAHIGRCGQHVIDRRDPQRPPFRAVVPCSLR